MCEFNKKNDSRKIDPCLVNLIAFLNQQNIKTISCCCGHAKHPMSIIVQTKVKGITRDICNDIYFDNKKKFYKKDKQGYYFIPEIKNI